jgi:two-component system sensor histidine kinase BarA
VLFRSIPAAAEVPVRDEAAALSAAAGNADLAAELLRALLREVPGTLQELGDLCRRGDWATLRDSAHRLHGGAAYCGVPAIKQAAKQLELSAQSQDPATVGRRLQALEREVARLRAYLDQPG